ncbi:MAG: TMEM165/GDT1 family protein [Candidatus Abyssubacteria bacterium]
MDIKIMASVFTAVFLAELGDKTQLAILGLAAESKSLGSVFIGATAAMLTATVLAVVLGGLIAHYVPVRIVHIVAGLAFITIGILMLAGKL